MSFKKIVFKTCHKIPSSSLQNKNIFSNPSLSQTKCVVKPRQVTGISAWVIQAGLPYWIMLTDVSILRFKNDSNFPQISPEAQR